MEAQLNFFRENSQERDCAWLEDLLDVHRGWMTAAEILSMLGEEDCEARKRQIRGLAAQSQWIISGQKGYKHLFHATAEEVDRCANWLESQAKQMSNHACAIRHNAHKIFG